MARRRKNGLNVHGVVLVDKPTGMTSNRVVQVVRRLFQANRAGHTGALDPLATGLLPVCLGEATKFSQLLLDADKGYLVTAQLGVRTDTSDADGQIISETEVSVNEAQLLQALEAFKGEIKQIPSMYSALKYQGKPLYEYARAGIEIPREARPITIYKIDYLGFQNDEVTLEVYCSKGTYIRTLIDDLGQLLGCGAHVKSLRRTKIGGLGTVESAVDLEALAQLDEGARQGYLLPMDTAALDLPKHYLSDQDLQRFLHGQPLLANVSAKLARVYDEAENFWGLVEEREVGGYWPRRVVVREN